MRLLTPTNLYERLGTDIATADSLTLCGRMESIAYMICLESHENKITLSASSKSTRNNRGKTIEHGMMIPVYVRPSLRCAQISRQRTNGPAFSTLDLLSSTVVRTKQSSGPQIAIASSSTDRPSTLPVSVYLYFFTTPSNMSPAPLTPLRRTTGNGDGQG